MSGTHFHVHGPHDHEVEHQGQRGDSFAARIAVTTAILSTIGAIFGFQAGDAGNDALIHKNDAAINKAHASDQWNFYQAKSGKQNLAELGLSIAPTAKQAFYQKEVERYKREKEDIKREAERFEEMSKKENERAEVSEHKHKNWAIAMTLIQVAISLAAVTLLTRKQWLTYGVYCASVLGIGFAALAFL